MDINWNPEKGGIEPDGGINSPAMVLLHEAIHGDHAITDLQGYVDNIKDTRNMSDFDNREEYNTIQETEFNRKKPPS